MSISNKKIERNKFEINFPQLEIEFLVQSLRKTCITHVVGNLI